MYRCFFVCRCTTSIVDLDFRIQGDSGWWFWAIWRPRDQPKAISFTMIDPKDEFFGL